MALIDIFSFNLKKYRIKSNLSQEELATLCNLHRTYISALERKKRNISLNNIEKISKALNIEPYKLLYWESEKHE